MTNIYALNTQLAHISFRGNNGQISLAQALCLSLWTLVWSGS